MLAAVFGLDQWSKWWMVHELHLAEGPMELLPLFNLVLVWNKGVSFGMFAGADQPLVLVGVSALIMATLFSWMLKTPSQSVVLALGAIMGGAAGNILDRLRFGAVIDFLDFHLGKWHWPAFNIADSAIFIGVVVLCAFSMFMERKTSKGHHP